MTAERLQLLSRSQVQMVEMNSRYDIGYQPELYVNRAEEAIFEAYRGEVEYGFGKVKNLSWF